MLAICASSPIPADEPTVAPVVPEVQPAAKSEPVVPVDAVKSLGRERTEPLALPSKVEEAAAPQKAEEKREAAPTPVEEPAVKSAEPQQPVQPLQPEQVTGKSLPEPAVAVPTPKVEPQPVETVKTLAAEPTVAQAPVEPTPTVAAVVPETKQVDDKQAVESTVVPVVPASIASEKKIDAGLYQLIFHYTNIPRLD